MTHITGAQMSPWRAAIGQGRARDRSAIAPLLLLLLLWGCGAEPAAEPEKQADSSAGPIFGAQADATFGGADAGAGVFDSGVGGGPTDSHVGSGQDSGGAVDDPAADDTATDDTGADTGAAPDTAADTGSGAGTADSGGADTAAAADVGKPVNPACGDGLCGDLEAIPTCAIDCDAMAKQIWTCAASSCGVQRATCAANLACTKAWQTAMLCLKVCDYQTSCVAKCSQELASSPAAQALGGCALPGCMAGGGSCGDGTCQAKEDAQSCPADCGAKSFCGDSTCDAGESASTCPADCGGGSSGGGGAAIPCGDEACGSGETAAACPLDCEPGAGKAWTCMESNCKADKSACQADATCLKVLNEAAICVKKCGGGSSCAQQCQGPVLGNSLALNLGLCALNKCNN